MMPSTDVESREFRYNQVIFQRPAFNPMFPAAMAAAGGQSKARFSIYTFTLRRYAVAWERRQPAGLPPEMATLPTA